MWWTREHLNEHKAVTFSRSGGDRYILDDGFFEDYYRPKVYTSFARLFAYNMISTYSRSGTSDESWINASPFMVRAMQGPQNR
ncbi:uncharacterized protein BJ171DRAFT_525183 [Polychytrium aggregatum]|uniref:uncharacterized protein n=1 Tax=Polychytrium aggregatum TaxID=110093 RepID=UPI0022FE046E|nr:uncharacterized protein BJ171DRAFT_525183 [Polychytrium aggregatum]KAI9193604.1 hypothetical protein BJ171DRAFT_525183 [Polychytrium aggregatum]